MAVLGRQSDSVVDHIHHEQIACLVKTGAHHHLAPVTLLVGRHHLDRLDGILHEIAESLTEHPSIEQAVERFVTEFANEIDMGRAHFAQEDRILQDAPEIGDFLRRLGHAGKRREFVDHAADIADLPDDRVRALIEDRPIILIDLLAVTALQPLRRQLDRRQRVLDLMGDAARHIRPCR
ncbi:hypothetical protein D3C73_495200 [compost metagenome]